jgi:hypothetical protein
MRSTLPLQTSVGVVRHSDRDLIVNPNNRMRSKKIPQLITSETFHRSLCCWWCTASPAVPSLMQSRRAFNPQSSLGIRSIYPNTYIGCEPKWNVVGSLVHFFRRFMLLFVVTLSHDPFSQVLQSPMLHCGRQETDFSPLLFHPLYAASCWMLSCCAAPRSFFIQQNVFIPISHRNRVGNLQANDKLVDQWLHCSRSHCWGEIIYDPSVAPCGQFVIVCCTIGNWVFLDQNRPIQS